jgi:DNA repair protein RadB
LLDIQVILETAYKYTSQCFKNEKRIPWQGRKKMTENNTGYNENNGLMASNPKRIEHRIDTGAECLNIFLEGGYESDIITTIYGEGGSGKTNLCMLATISTIESGKKVIYIDTEGNFSVARLQQLSPNYREILESVLLVKITDFEQQNEVLARMDKLVTSEIGLVVFDSMAPFYRLEKADKPDETTEINRVLGKQLNNIARIARTKNIPVIVTNQVWQSFSDSSNRMVGGNLLIYSSKCIIELRKLKTGKREAILKKHRSLPEGKELGFEIIESGIVPL